jgi:hypothetical protein
MIVGKHGGLYLAYIIGRYEVPYHAMIVGKHGGVYLAYIKDGMKGPNTP